MQVELTESDFTRALGADAVKRLSREREEHVLGEAETEAVMDAMPKALASRFKRMLPDHFEIREITLKVSLSGKPFGVGMSGDATVKFGPASAKTST